MNNEDKNLVEMAYKALNISNLNELAVILGYSSTTANNWYQNGLNEKVRSRIEKKLSNSPTSLHVNTITATKLSPKMDELVRWFSVLDKDDQKRIYNEIKALADKKLDLSHL